MVLVMLTSVLRTFVKNLKLEMIDEI